MDNRAGAGGTIGSAQVAKSSPDGYTLLLGSSGTISSAPAVFKTISYDPLKDFVAVGRDPVRADGADRGAEDARQRPTRNSLPM